MRAYIVARPFKAKTGEVVKVLEPGKTFYPASIQTERKMLDAGYIMPSVTSWLERLSDSEREIFEERAAIMEYEGGLHKELAEIEAIKRIIKERIIPGKCDRCDGVKGCMLTKKQRMLCAVVSQTEGRKGVEKNR